MAGDMVVKTAGSETREPDGDPAPKGTEELARVRPIEVLCSKILHDLASVIGAIKNGTELIEEIGPDPDALDLVTQSARTAANRVALYRFLYGAGSSGAGAADQIRRIFEDYFDGSNVRVVWHGDPEGWPQIRRPGAAKLLAGTVLAVAETLIRGGEIEVGVVPGGVQVRGTGADVRLPDGAREMIEGHVDEAPSARLVPWWMMATAGEAYGFSHALQRHDRGQIVLALKG